MNTPTQSEATSEQDAVHGGFADIESIKDALDALDDFRLNTNYPQHCDALLPIIDKIAASIEQRVLSKQDSGEAVCVVHILDGEHVSINCTQALFNLPDGKHLLYTNPQPAVADGWQPIETAPKDGTSILLLYKGHAIEACWECVETGDWESGLGPVYYWSSIFDYFDDGTEPTHWMSLPAIPSSQQVKKEGECEG